MTRLTIEVPDEVAQRVVGGCRGERGVAPEALVAEAVTERFPPRRQLGFIGLGHSGEGDLSGRVKELRRDVAHEKLQRMADERRSVEG